MDRLSELKTDISSALAAEGVEGAKEIMKQRLGKESQKLKLRLNKRLEAISSYMETAPGMKLMDKLTFNFGVILFAVMAFIMGRSSTLQHDTFFYNFYAVLIPTMIFVRWYVWRKSGAHYYLFDFCYFANIIIWIFVMFFPKNEDLYLVCFHFANGTLGVSTVAFSNALVFHKIQVLITLGLHTIPLLVFYNIRFVSMKHQASLGAE